MEVERVQALATAGLDILPSQFVRPSHEQPENTKAIKGVTVPVLSLSGTRESVVEAMYRACNEWGFFLLTDHGIPLELVERLKEVGVEFFSQPQAEKEKYANDPTKGSFEGYGTKMTKNHDEKIEWIDYFFHVMSPDSRVKHEVWPQNPPSYRLLAFRTKKGGLRKMTLLTSLLIILGKSQRNTTGSCLR